MPTVAGGEKLVEFHVDFNDVDQENRLRALGRYASPGWESVRPGQWVRAYDGDGNRCLAYVDAVKDDFFYLRADWTTWQAGDTSHLRITREAPRAQQEQQKAVGLR
jgi:hypothetical protein